MGKKETTDSVDATKSTTKEKKPCRQKKAAKNAKSASKTAKKGVKTEKKGQKSEIPKNAKKSEISHPSGEKPRRTTVAGKTVEKVKQYDPNAPQDIGNEVLFNQYAAKGQNFDKEKFEEMCEHQHTQRYICAKFNMTSKTLHKYIMKNYGYSWSHVYAVLRSKGIGAVKEALYKKAVGGDTVAMKLYLERYGHVDLEADPMLRLRNAPATVSLSAAAQGQDGKTSPEFNISIGVMKPDDANIYDVDPES